MLMVRNNSAEVLGYEAPTMISSEVSVENGFAASGFGDPGRAGDDLSSDGNIYDF